MNADKKLRQIERYVAEQRALPPCRRSAGDVGGIKLLPTLTHGAEDPVRVKTVPVAGIPMKGTRVDLDALEDFE